MAKQKKRGRVQLHCPGKGRTKQAFKDETDINQIMKRYMKTGILDHARKHEPEYGFATSTDFQESMEIILRAQNMFQDLPAQVRSRFQNEPGQFLDFVQDPENQQDLFDMGLSTYPPLQPQVIPEETPVSEASAEPVQ